MVNSRHEYLEAVGYGYNDYGALVSFIFSQRVIWSTTDACIHAFETFCSSMLRKSCAVTGKTGSYLHDNY